MYTGPVTLEYNKYMYIITDTDDWILLDIHKDVFRISTSIIKYNIKRKVQVLKSISFTLIPAISWIFNTSLNKFLVSFVSLSLILYQLITNHNNPYRTIFAVTWVIAMGPVTRASVVFAISSSPPTSTANVFLQNPTTAWRGRPNQSAHAQADWHAYRTLMCRHLLPSTGRASQTLARQRQQLRIITSTRRMRTHSRRPWNTV